MRVLLWGLLVFCANQAAARGRCSSALLDAAAFYRPRILSAASPESPHLSVLSERQNILRDGQIVDAIRRSMLARSFVYAAMEHIVSGYYDRRENVFYVGEGHHRFAAALEIARDRGDWAPFKQLLNHGLWEVTDHPPSLPCDLPVRQSLTEFFRWRALLLPLR